MSAQTGVLQRCQDMQAQLLDYWNACSDASEPLPLYEMVISPANRGSLQMVISPGDSKVRNVQLLYTPRIPISEVDEDVEHPTCTATDVRGDRWQYYTIDTTRNVSVNEKITLTDLTEVCRPNSTIFQEKISKMLDAIDRKMAYRLTEEIVLLAGDWGADVANVDVNENLEVRTYRTGSTDSLSPQTMQKIRRATQQSGYCAPYMIAGGTEIADYADAIQLGCCTDYGMDLAATFARFGSAVAYDRAVVEAMGGDEFALSVMQGAVQVVTWNLYDMAPWNAFNAGNEIIMKISTRRGLPVDFMAKYDCGEWHLVMTATAEAKALPTDMFVAGDIFEGVNMLNKIEVVNS